MNWRARPADRPADHCTAAARDAFARQAWKDAYARFRAADEARAQLEAEDLERLAVCAFMVGSGVASADAWARSHSEWLRLREVRRAARCTFWLVLDLVTRGERAQARGWLARTQTLLEAGGCAEQGLLLVLTAARLRIHEKDIDGAHDLAARAADLARRFDDSELQVFSRLCLAQEVAMRGDTAAATALFDEIMVAVTVGDVSPVGIGTVYCAVIEGCQALLDLGRARMDRRAVAVVRGAAGSRSVPRDMPRPSCGAAAALRRMVRGGGGRARLRVAHGRGILPASSPQPTPPTVVPASTATHWSRAFRCCGSRKGGAARRRPRAAARWASGSRRTGVPRSWPPLSKS